MAQSEKQKRIIRRWIKNLESGEYRQGRGCLVQTNKTGLDKFCCLGVLCDMAVRAKVIPAPSDSTRSYSDLTWSYGGSRIGLPSKVRKWAGIKTPSGDFTEDSGLVFTSSLARLNDTGKSFKSIAKVIKSEPVGLFT